MSKKENVQQAGVWVMRYSVALILFWFGLSKFTPTEAGHVADLVKAHPLMSWLYNVLSVQGVSSFIGVVEVTAAVLIAARPVAPRLALWGSLMGALSFLFTVSFMFTDGKLEVVDGLLVLGGIGGFVVKDLVMLGFCVWSAGEAWASLEEGKALESVPATIKVKEKTFV
ncbi:DUF417 family protein [Pontibacter pamirensis]|uniref:DUF417 family protein n=1 Tax=Pontibacter pamirensis TaxID=2562824 RepID=UPI00138985AA|nr:DUF417 family protein [Pontibacter pamirensis]